MKRIVLLLAVLGIVSCQREETLQQYMVQKSNEPEFISFDMSPSILNLKEGALSDEQRRTLEAFRKVNVLAYKNDSTQPQMFKEEAQKVKLLLKEEKYQELVHVSKGVNGGSISYVGTEDHIDEFVFYAADKKYGFALVRVLGDDMDSKTMMDMIALFQQADLDIEGLKPIKQLMAPTPFLKH